MPFAGHLDRQLRIFPSTETVNQLANLLTQAEAEWIANSQTSRDGWALFYARYILKSNGYQHSVLSDTPTGHWASGNSISQLQSNPVIEQNNDYLDYAAKLKVEKTEITATACVTLDAQDYDSDCQFADGQDPTLP